MAHHQWEASAYYAAGTAQYPSMRTSCTRCASMCRRRATSCFARLRCRDARGNRTPVGGPGLLLGRKRGKFCINGVTGPDEYNAVVNNNAYTNLMARENLRYATQVVELLRKTEPDAYNALVHKTALEPSEVSAWIRAAENMYVPYDEKLKIIPQDDNFLDKSPGISGIRRPTTIPCCYFTIR